MNTLPKSKSSAGQALLVAVLAIAVSLIVVLSIISRSITDVAVSNKEDESLRAFSAAEAGVEKALIMGSDQSGSFTANGASFVAKVIPTQGSTEIPGVGLLSGETMTVWFVSHNPDGTVHLSCSDPAYPCFTGTNMDVCWEKRVDETSETIPAIEVSVYYGPTTDIRIYRAAIDPASPIRGSFSPAGLGTCTIGTDIFAYRQNISSLPAGKIFAKVRVLYNTDPVMLGIKSPESRVFPSQGTTVTSSGLAGDSNRKISVSQSYNEPAAVFETGIYSGGGLSK